MEKYEEIVNIQKLVDEKSFPMWKFQVTILLKSYGLNDVVQGQIGESPEKNYELKDARAQKILMTTIDKKNVSLIMSCKNSKEMFEKLNFIFQQNTEQHKCKLLQDFFQYKYNLKENMSHHISTLENLAYQLNTLDEKVNDTMLISKILSTLPMEYINFSTAWESSSSTEKTLRNLIARLITEEQRVKSHIEIEEKTAFRASKSYFTNSGKNFHKQNSIKKKYCTICKKNNHFDSDCYFKRKPCGICKKTNHEERNCYFKINSGNKKLSFLTFSKQENNGEEFVIDSGSTSHMTNNRKLLSGINESNSIISIAKRNEKITSNEMGKIETNKYTLNEVLFVPDLQKNLLSVSVITDKGGEVLFTKKEVLVSKNKEIIIKGKKNENGLYTINLKSQKEALVTYKKETALEWHIKLGHPSKESMKKLLKLSNGINITESDIDNLSADCEVCLKAKQSRLPFDNMRHRSDRPLAIIHTDVCGPFTPETYDGKKYIVTFLDDFTNFAKIALLKNKHEVAEELKYYIREVER